MKTYLCPATIALPVNQSATLRRLLLALLLLTFYSLSVSAQELVFKNPTLVAGVDKADGATYLFEKVNDKVDAVITINKRSSDLVQLVSIDLNGMGHNKAFQPQVTYNNNTTPAGFSDWWMEFQISFVATGTNTPAEVDSFRVTGLDIDGNNDKINEWVSFYNNKTYMFEQTTQLVSSNVMELLGLINTIVGKKFVGPVTNFSNVDTNATDVMVTNTYQAVNSFRIRTGGSSTGASGAADRMYSFYFKSFNFRQANEFRLPLVLLGFNTTLNNKKVNLSWVTGQEKELSHFVVERSSNGSDFKEVGMIMANGNSDVKVEYAYSDAVNTEAKGVIYYRLKMVDMDGKFQRSAVRLIRIGEQKEAISVSAYPNPVVSELRVTVPANWQNKTVSFDLYNANGQIVKHAVATKASQTETVNVNELPTGMYIMKVSNGSETAVQRIVKGK